MFGGLNRALVAAAIAAAVLAVPPTALACNSGVSAVNVYKECLPSGGGGKSTSSHNTSSSGGTNTSGGSTSVPLSKQTAQALKKAGSDGKSLSRLVQGFGVRRVLQSSHASEASTPTAVGSAFDLGSGPTALLIVLAGTAVLLLGATGFRYTRHRR